MTLVEISLEEAKRFVELGKGVLCQVNQNADFKYMRKSTRLEVTWDDLLKIKFYLMQNKLVAREKQESPWIKFEDEEPKDNSQIAFCTDEGTDVGGYIIGTYLSASEHETARVIMDNYIFRIYPPNSAGGFGRPRPIAWMPVPEYRKGGGQLSKQ